MNVEAEKKSRTIHIGLLAAFIVVLIWSVIQPYNLLFWLMQALAAIIMVLVLLLTYRKFTFTTFVYVLVFFHTIILLVGAHYTYSHNPLFDWLMNTFMLSRNYYDRVGHFAQGFMPAFALKEFLLRTGHVKKGKMLSFIVISMCLGFSAFYELLELAASFILGLPGEVVMGFQGDIWDSHWDMSMALIGAMTAIFIFGALHDKHMAKISKFDKLTLADR
jgi:putative membrane protein